MLLALNLGATFIARSFSGDKAQLVPILKAGLKHNGFALIDVISRITDDTADLFQYMAPQLGASIAGGCTGA